MNFTEQDVEELRAILTLCKTVGIDGAVLADGKVMGAASSKKLAIISPTKLSIDPETKVGIGRLTELEKRLTIFAEGVVMTAEINKSGEVSRLTMAAGRTKAQFRCSATSMVLHPKSNDDAPVAALSLSKTEVAILVKAAKIFGAETIIFKISPAGDVHIECVDSTNDQFSTGTEKQAEFIDEADPLFFTYQASYLTTVLAEGTKDADSIDLVFGQAGSITALVKGYSLMVMPNINED
jgi:hypothetical protein